MEAQRRKPKAASLVRRRIPRQSTMKRHFVLDPDWRHSLVSSCFVFGKSLDEVRPVSWPDWMSRHKLMRPPYRFDSCWCPGCKFGVRNRPFKGIPISLLESTPPQPLACTDCREAFLVHDSLLEVFDCTEWRENVRLGPVLLQDGSVGKDWHSAVFRARKILRGSKNAAFRICPCCGRVVYFAMGRRFICPSETDAEIMGGNEMVISESVLTEKRKRWIAGEKGLAATGIKTTRTPLDGFASDLPWYADENPSVFRPYLAEEFIKAVSVDNPRDRQLDLAVAHSEMAASGNGIDSVLPIVEGKLTSLLRRRLDKFLSLDEKEKSVLPLYEERGFSVGLPVAGHR